MDVWLYFMIHLVIQWYSNFEDFVVVRLEWGEKHKQMAWTFLLLEEYPTIPQSNILLVAPENSPSQMGVSENRDTHKSSILIGFSIINHPFWGIPIFGNTQMGVQISSSNHPIFRGVYSLLSFGGPDTSSADVLRPGTSSEATKGRDVLPWGRLSLKTNAFFSPWTWRVGTWNFLEKAYFQGRTVSFSTWGYHVRKRKQQWTCERQRGKRFVPFFQSFWTHWKQVRVWVGRWQLLLGIAFFQN